MYRKSRLELLAKHQLAGRRSAHAVGATAKLESPAVASNLTGSCDISPPDRQSLPLDHGRGVQLQNVFEQDDTLKCRASRIRQADGAGDWPPLMVCKAGNWLKLKNYAAMSIRDGFETAREIPQRCFGRASTSLSPLPLEKMGLSIVPPIRKGNCNLPSFNVAPDSRAIVLVKKLSLLVISAKPR
jgi:hypothetical protein